MRGRSTRRPPKRDLPAARAPPAEEAPMSKSAEEALLQCVFRVCSAGRAALCWAGRLRAGHQSIAMSSQREPKHNPRKQCLTCGQYQPMRAECSMHSHSRQIFRGPAYACTHCAPRSFAVLTCLVCQALPITRGKRSPGVIQPSAYAVLSAHWPVLPDNLHWLLLCGRCISSLR